MKALRALCASAFFFAAVVPTTAASSQTVVGVVVGASPVGVVHRGLFGVDLFWAQDAEGAFDVKAHEFYPGFVRELRQLGRGAVRYPGGTTSDSFQWGRAVGPLARRGPNEPYGVQGPGGIVDGPEPSVVGPDELGTLLGELGAQGTITANFATGTAQEAADWVAYMTAPLPRSPVRDPRLPGYWAGLRAKHGHPAPYDVPYWEVGNEQFAPAQFGWRSGSLVAYGPGASGSQLCQPGSAGHVQSCLYTFGGTTAFSRQPVGRYADELPSASYSTGAPSQAFFVYYPPVVASSATVYVSGVPWREVPRLPAAGPDAHVYSLDSATGEIRFGGGEHGAVPPRDARITVSYESGPHNGFVEFYDAMKAMNPDVQVCESEGLDVSFMQIVGAQYPYDCVVMHGYMPAHSPGLGLGTYEEDLLSAPVAEAWYLVNLQEAGRYYSGRNVPVVVTEYGQPVAPPPAGDPYWNLSMGEALLTMAQLTEWAYHRVTLAEKQVAVSDPFDGVLRSGDAAEALSTTNAVIAHAGPRFFAEPSGLAMGLLSEMAGGQLLPVTLYSDPSIGVPTPTFMGSQYATEVWAIAAQVGPRLMVALENASPTEAVTAELSLPVGPGRHSVVAYTLDGPAVASYNSPAHPRTVRVTESREVASGSGITLTLGPHSIVLLAVVE